MTVLPSTETLEIYGRASFYEQFDISDTNGPIDFTGKTAVMDIKTNPNDKPVVRLTNTTGLTLGNGFIGITLTATQTAALQAMGKDLIWDLMVNETTDRNCYLKGTIKLILGVTDNG